MKLNDLKKLIKTVEESNIEELEIKGIFRTVRVTKKRGATAVVTEKQETPAKKVEEVVATPAAQETPKETTPAPTSQPAESGKNLVAIKAPMIGTFYRAPSPTSPPYVEIGDKISKGKVVCIIEAMKVMNEIESDVSGTVREILIENAKPIEYGQALFMIEC